ncbi:MAG: acyltransferase [Caldilineaceae bacterium]
MRRIVLQWAGFRIGSGTVFWGTPTITGDANLYKRLVIGQGCWFNLGCFFDLGANITIGNRVAFGHAVMLLTTTHQMGDLARRAGPFYTKPICIEDGAWICARSTILPGVTIGEGAVVAAGAVVTKSVEPNVMVGGIPARPIRTLSVEDDYIRTYANLEYEAPRESAEINARIR